MHRAGHVVLHRNEYFRSRDNKNKKADGNGKTSSESSDSDASSSPFSAERENKTPVTSNELEKPIEPPTDEQPTELPADKVTDQPAEITNGPLRENGVGNHDVEPVKRVSVAECSSSPPLLENGYHKLEHMDKIPQTTNGSSCTERSLQTDCANGDVADTQETRGRKDSSPKLLSVEDEERFLRDLGWVPEEEAHVPELTEEEKLEVKNVLQSKAAGMNKAKQSLDNAIKRWQQEKFQSVPIPCNE